MPDPWTKTVVGVDKKYVEDDYWDAEYVDDGSTPEASHDSNWGKQLPLDTTWT